MCLKKHRIIIVTVLCPFVLTRFLNTYNVLINVLGARRPDHHSCNGILRFANRISTQVKELVPVEAFEKEFVCSFEIDQNELCWSDNKPALFIYDKARCVALGSEQWQCSIDKARLCDGVSQCLSDESKMCSSVQTEPGVFPR